MWPLLPQATRSAAPSLAQSEPTTLGQETGPLAAGTYADTSTGPSVIFTVDDSRVVTREPQPEVGTELAPAGFDGIVTLTTFDGTIFSQPCAAKGRVDKLLKKTETIDANAASFVEAMAGHGSLEVREVQATELGGLPALQLDVVSLPGKKCRPKTAFLWQLPIVREFHLDKGAIARIVATDVGDETVIAVIQAPAQTGASPFAFLEKSMALLGTSRSCRPPRSSLLLPPMPRSTPRSIRTRPPTVPARPSSMSC